VLTARSVTRGSIGWGKLATAIGWGFGDYVDDVVARLRDTETKSLGSKKKHAV
jgi:hypothetical protein